MSHITDNIKRTLFNILGTIFLGIGCIGIILPILPTTPFLLLAAACYLRGSQRMHHWLITNRVFGGFINNYLQGRGIRRRQKAVALFSLWLMISATIIYFLDNILLRLLLVAIAGAVSIHILKLPSLPAD